MKGLNPNSDAKSCESRMTLNDPVYKKSFVTRNKASRTANRHRWAGRVDQGGREKDV